MNLNVLRHFINNSGYLLILSIIYEVIYYIPLRYRKLQPIISGLFISVICFIIMSTPIELQSGIYFDTRSILISVTALMFEPVPTAIVVASAALYRLSMGGIGMLPGLIIIFNSALIGLAWQIWLYTKSKRWRWLNIYAMSISVHVIALATLLMLPSPDSINIIKETAIPVLLIFPIVSVLLGLLLIRQRAHQDIQDELKQSEKKFQDLFYQAPLGYQFLNADGCFIEVNQQWLTMLGYAKDEVIGKWFGDFVAPEYVDTFKQRFSLFKKQGYMRSELEMLHKNGEKVFIAFEGKIKEESDGKFTQTHCILQDLTKQKKAEDALIKSEKKYRYIAENMSDVVWQTDTNFKMTYVSPSVEKHTGYTVDEHFKRTGEDRFPPQTMNKIGFILSEEIEMEKDPRLEKNRSRSIEVEYISTDHTINWVEMNISILRDENDTMVGFQGVARDITQRKRAENELMESERSKAVLLSNLPGMAYRCNNDCDWTMQFVSAGCLELTGYAAESLLYNKDLSYNSIIIPEYRDNIRQALDRALEEKSPFKYEYEITAADGNRKWVLEMGEGVYDKNGKVEALEGIIIDIHERKKIENKIKYNNEHDLWTGLYSRGYLENLLDHDAANTHGAKRAVVGIDLSAIYSLRAAYGFHYSRKLIKRVADALKHHTHSTCRLFQLYENQFAFYLHTYTDKNELAALCEDIISTLESVLTVERIGGSIGIVEIDDQDKKDADRTLRNLIIASENANNGSNADFGFCFYNTKMEAKLMREKEIVQELSQIAAGEDTDRLFIQFQPILDIKLNKICGFEALARLNNDTYGLISPMEFIPIAEKTKLIIPFGQHIILKALRFISNLRDKGYGAITVAINISAIQLMKNDFAKTLKTLIEDMHLDSQQVIIEITESLFTSNYLRLNQILADLQEFGIKIAIDDFGTGYSSLSRVMELNVDYLKIDKLFIDKLLPLTLERALTGDIIAMAHKLGHCVIAEGVEDQRQLKYLKEQGCDKIQGYLISKPVSEEASYELLKCINQDFPKL